MTIILRASTRAMSLVRPSIADRDIRYYLNGIYFEPCPLGGITVVATNGCHMTAVHDIEGYCEAPIIVAIPKDAWKHCDKPTKFDLDYGNKLRKPRSLKKEPSMLVIDHTGTTDDYGNLIMSWKYDVSIEKFVAPAQGRDRGLPVWRAPIGRNCIIDGRYPDWRKVMPKTPEEWAALGPCEAFMGAEYIRALASVSEKSKGWSNNVRLWQKPKVDEWSGLNGSPIMIQHSAFPEMVQVLMPVREDSPKWIVPDHVKQVAA